MDKTEWLEARKQGIGGTDAAAILELSKYRTPLDVFLDKTNRSEPIEDTEAMNWGRTMETAVASEYVMRTGDKVRRMGMRKHKDNPWMLANIDRQIIGDPKGPGVLECKTSSAYRIDEWGDTGTDQIPADHYAQVCHYLAVTGYAFARLAVLIGGNDFRFYDIPRDEDLIKRLIDIERDFWFDNVQQDMPPTPKTSADLAKLWPQDSGREVIASADTLSSVFKLRTVKSQLNALNQQKSDLEDDIRRALADASWLIDDDGNRLASWKTQESRRLDTSKVKAVLGDQLPEYQTVTTNRVLRIKA